jgi:hypothetical protein
LEIIFRVALTAVIAAIAFGGIYTVWTRPIDIVGTLSKPLSFLWSEKKTATLDVDVKQVVGAQFRGVPGENVTVKKIVLRVKGRREDIDSTVLITGQVETPKGEIDSIIVQVANPGKVANIILMNWKNLRPILSELKMLSPGAVLAGSAVFVIDGMTLDQFKRLEMVELVAIDFAGNEATKQIDIAPDWVTRAAISSVADREFLSKGYQEPITWK